MSDEIPINERVAQMRSIEKFLNLPVDSQATVVDNVRNKLVVPNQEEWLLQPAKRFIEWSIDDPHYNHIFEKVPFHPYKIFARRSYSGLKIFIPSQWSKSLVLAVAIL